MRAKLLIDSQEFADQLQCDIQAAQQSVFVQTLSFECDKAGKLLSESLLSSTAKDQRLLIDCFNNVMLSDHFLYSPRNFFNNDLWRERKQTQQLLSELKNSAVKVQYTNPLGYFLRKLTARNHKKIITIDDAVSYIGGINFSEHNFHWHDMMLRFDDEVITDFLKQEFLHTWAGRNQNLIKSFKEIDFLLFDGKNNEKNFDVIIQLIKSAKKNIFVQSPYITFPFLDHICQRSRAGVPVSLVMPQHNNWRLLNNYLLWKCGKDSLALYLYQGRLTHLKAMLIDDKYLIIGSSNYDYFSYRSHQEIVAIIYAADIIADFNKRVVQEDINNSIKVQSQMHDWKGKLNYLGVKSGMKLLTLFAKGWV